MTNPHPTPEACESVARTLETACDYLDKIGAPPVLDMDSLEVFRGNCKTLACHGGHFLLAHLIEDPEAREHTNFREFTGPTPLDHEYFDLKTEGHWYNSWCDGATLMAERLGFRRDDKDTNSDIQERLVTWAEENPDLWGNENGSEMFQHAAAFSKDCSRKNEDAVRNIAKHWRAVGERIRASENQN